jgi:hypothetical protein
VPGPEHGEKDVEILPATRWRARAQGFFETTEGQQDIAPESGVRAAAEPTCSVRVQSFPLR